MRKIGLILGLFLLASGVMAFADNAKLDFTLVNQTGKDIHYVYVAPSDSDDWGDDVMGEDVLMNKDSVDITFSPKAKSKLWDLQVEYSDGKTSVWESLDLSQIDTLTLKIEKGKATAYWK